MAVKFVNLSVTPHVAVRSEAQAQALGAAAYMVKPPTPQMLRDHVLGCQQIPA